ncbi:MAG: type I secretion system permease/ATPase [Legionellales bacterium]|nr:type I secretion system permease/ATPase [Legionellales bacterium]
MVKNKEQQIWTIDSEVEKRKDPLLHCLILITKLHNKPFSADSLTAGLPLVNYKLTTELMPRAAERAGFSTKIIDHPINGFNNLILPAILILKDDQACVLDRIENDGSLSIIQPKLGKTKTKIEEINKLYTGKTIFLKPDYKFDERTEPMVKTKPKHWFWSVILKSYPIYSEVLVASLLVNMFALASPLFVMNVYDRVVPNNAIETLWVLAIGIFIVYSFDIIMKMLRGYFIDSASKRIDAELSSTIFERILGIKLSNLPKSVGTLSNMVYSFEGFRDFITSSTISLLIDLPFVSIFIFIIWYLAGSLALVPLIIAPLVILSGYFIQMPINNLIQHSYRISAEKQAALLESLHGIETIKSLSAEGIQQRKWETITCQGAVINEKLRYYNNLSSNVCMFFQSLATVILVIFGVYKIAAGDLTMGALIASTILTGRAISPMTQVARLMTRYQQSITALHSIDELMKLPVERPKGKTPLQRPQAKGKIEFLNVEFSYPNQKLAALNKISFKINPGEKVGIVGKVGSGKSTIEKLIAGLYEPTNGKILLDDTELKQLDKSEVRRQIAYVSQEIILFYGTMRENIALQAPYVNDSEILKAAQFSGINDFIRLHPDGFDMQIEEGGKNLSGGQKQMIAIARAFLHSPPLILLDEPTSAMDDKSSLFFKRMLQNELKDNTLILVTHRSDMLNIVNRLIIIDKGRIIADGPKNNILKALRSTEVVKQ